jgi:hypothetical protein
MKYYIVEDGEQCFFRHYTSMGETHKTQDYEYDIPVSLIVATLNKLYLNLSTRTVQKSLFKSKISASTCLLAREYAEFVRSKKFTLESIEINSINEKGFFELKMGSYPN